MATAEVGDLLVRELDFDVVRFHRFTSPLRGIILLPRRFAQQLPSSSGTRNYRKSIQNRKWFQIPFIETPSSPITRHLRLVPSHLITRFARASTSGGIVRPICFAAFKLITNSNFVACCTGKSAGLAPFKILST